MAFNCNDFLKLSELLLGDKRYTATLGEGTTRTVIGRAYYAAFLHARQQLEQKYHTTFSQGPKVHEQVAKRLKTDNPKLGSILHNLRLKRNKADYNIVITCQTFEAVDAIGFAKQLVTDLTK